MAARCSATGQNFSRTTNLPAATAITICGHANVVANRGSAQKQSVSSCEPQIIEELWWNGYSGAGGMTLESDNGTTNDSQDFPSRAAVGADFFWFFRCSGTGAGLLQAGYVLSTGNTLIKPTNITLQNATLNKIWLASNVNNEWTNIRIWGVKLYDASLSDAEVLEERKYYWPGRTANLNSFFPMLDATAANSGLDLSGLGRNLTRTGTTTVEAGSVIRRDPRWAYS